MERLINLSTQQAKTLMRHNGVFSRQLSGKLYVFPARFDFNRLLSSPQSVRNLTPVFHETSAKLVAQWLKVFDQSHSEEAVIEVTNWAGRFA